MGGSGGSFPKDFDHRQVDDVVQQSVEDTKRAEYEGKVSEMLSDYLVQANERDADKINGRLEQIKKQLENDIEEGPIKLNFGGSVKKHTFVNGLSDIDALVILNDTELVDKNPKQVQKYFLSKIQDKISGVKKIDQGTLATTVEFADGMAIQLLPAIKTKTGIRIPATSGNEWSNIINPYKFAEKLTKTNNELNAKAVPAIKIIKIINDQFPEKRKLSGYHIESLAIEAFKTFKEKDITTKNLIAHFFKETKDLVKSPIKDKTGQSVHVDDDLGGKNSETRKGISYQLEFIYRKIKEADRSASFETWSNILGEI